MIYYSKFVFSDKKGFDMIVKEELGNRSFRLSEKLTNSTTNNSTSSKLVFRILSTVPKCHFMSKK